MSRELHKAILGDDRVVIGTTTLAHFERLQNEPLIRQNTNRLDVPPATTPKPPPCSYSTNNGSNKSMKLK
ncbi:MAG: hypothetical protein M5U34_02325 [Chloroflexi bacterium]|nr:hypothetical protein [Chloroflexota bacterium]